MKTAVSRYNALLVLLTLLVAVASLAFNYHLIYRERLAHARDMLNGSVNHHLIRDLRGAEYGDKQEIHRLSEIIHDSLHIPGVQTFGVVMGAQGQVVGGIGITSEVRRSIEARTPVLGIDTLSEDDKTVLLPISASPTYRVVLGFAKDSLTVGVWPLTAYTALFVAAALSIYFMIAFTALRHWIVRPLVLYLETHLRGSIDGIISGNIPPDIPSGRLAVLPTDLSGNIENNIMALHTWARHKANFDKFIAVSTAENNKQQLLTNLHNILKFDLPLTSLAVLEVNSSQNRLVPIYDSTASIDGVEVLSDPQRCFVYRSVNRLVQMPGETVCTYCRAGNDEVQFCKPLVAAGKEMGVLRATLDWSRMERELAGSGGGNSVAVAEALLDTYVYFTALTLSNLTLLDSYKNQAITDGLTGLYNRRYIVEYLSSILSISRRGNKPVAVFMIDIDNFKRLNDEYGHNVGDQVLQTVARQMRRAIRDCDIIARYGGEEFIVVLPETDCAVANEVGERLRESVAGIEWDSIGLGNVPQVTVSVGIAEFPLHGYSHYHLTNAADKALYVAKRSGKNRVEIHQPLPGFESD